jgi:hypothetical protein
VALALAVTIGILARSWFGAPMVALAVAPGVLLGASQPGEDSFGYVLGLDLMWVLLLVGAAAAGASARAIVHISQSSMRARRTSGR